MYNTLFIYYFQVSTGNPIGNGNGLETAATGDHAYQSKTTDNTNPVANKGNTPTTSRTIKTKDYEAEKFVTTQKSKWETEIDLVDGVLSDDSTLGDFDYGENVKEDTEEYNNDDIEKVIVSRRVFINKRDRASD